MASKMILILPFFLTALFCSQLLLAIETDISQHKGFLGRVGNKAYLVERDYTTQHRNWTAAKLYCQSLGMTLAKIETAEELAFLNSKFQPGVFGGWHWTAARDSHQPEQFVWDDNNSSVTVDVTWRTHYDLETAYLSCAAFHMKAMNTSEMFMLNCDQTNGYVLCEI